MTIIFKSEGPLAYTALTRSEIPKEAVLMGDVTGQSCQYSLSVPLSVSLRSNAISGAMGNGGYAKIMRTAPRQESCPLAHLP